MIKLTINGKPRSFEGDSDMPLLWFLRDEMGLTGTKFGCGKGLCGNCTVHMNGQAVRSCTTTMAALEGAEITTIEGLAAEASNPLLAAWTEYDVPQCGYCQPGQIMQAASLLAENPNPADEEIRASMQGVLCRCGTYPRIEKAIKSVAGGDL